MKALVTGATGFIGGALAAALAERGVARRKVAISRENRARVATDRDDRRVGHAEGAGFAAVCAERSENDARTADRRRCSGCCRHGRSGTRECAEVVTARSAKPIAGVDMPALWTSDATGRRCRRTCDWSRRCGGRSCRRRWRRVSGGWRSGGGRWWRRSDGRHALRRCVRSKRLGLSGAARKLRAATQAKLVVVLVLLAAL